MPNQTRKSKLYEEWEHPFYCWLPILGSVPVALLDSVDYAGSYERREAHIFRLENGQYAFIVEEGCSCYEPYDAEITIHPSLSAARTLLAEWKSKKAR